MLRLPVAIVIITVWCYWLSVLLMVLRSHLKLKTAAGAVPTTDLEGRLWLIWVPTVMAWLLFPGVGYMCSLPLLRAPQWSVDHHSVFLDWFAASAAVLAYLLTVPCWLTLGSNWSLAVVPGKETSLITHGVYARVRHPIYALGLMLMAATIVVIPSTAMLIVASAHFILVLLKSANEERFLKQKHGQDYTEYCHRTRRFFPWPDKM